MRASLILIALAACGRLHFNEVGADGANAVFNRVFVTSSVHVPGDFGGLAGGDAVCDARARDGGLAGTFVAWLSTSTVRAPDRLRAARGWVRVDGEPVADTVDDLLAGNLYHSIRIDEQGRDLGSDPMFVATGTLPRGGGENCLDLTSLTARIQVTRQTFAGDAWSSSRDDVCSVPERLYCFQIDHDLPLTFPKASGRRAFVTAGTYDGTTGLAAADALCNAEARAASLGGTFAAVLMDASPAASRFDATGPPWVRTDGVSLAPTAAELLAGGSTAPLNVTAAGAFSIAPYAMTGAPLGDLSAPPDPLKNCNEWSNPAGGNIYGAPYATGVEGWSQTTAACGEPEQIYCLEL